MDDSVTPFSHVFRKQTDSRMVQVVKEKTNHLVIVSNSETILQQKSDTVHVYPYSWLSKCHDNGKFDFDFDFKRKSEKQKKRKSEGQSEKMRRNNIKKNQVIGFKARKIKLVKRKCPTQNSDGHQKKKQRII